MIKDKVKRSIFVSDFQLSPVSDFATYNPLYFIHVDDRVRVSLVHDECKCIISKQRLLVIMFLLPDQGFFTFRKLTSGDDKAHAVSNKKPDGRIFIAICGEHGRLWMTGVEEFRKFLHDGLKTDVGCKANIIFMKIIVRRFSVASTGDDSTENSKDNRKMTYDISHNG